MATKTDSGDPGSFASMLKEWRRLSGLSQLELAMRCGSSQKHISFLESRRSNPSRVMIFALSEALEIPMRSRNDLMLAAGFAPTYKERPFDDPELESIRMAIDHILSAHQPYPAIVFDWRHDIIQANDAAMRLMLFLFDVSAPEEMPYFSNNLLRGMLHPDGYRASITNWDQTASTLLRRLRSEIFAIGNPEEGIAFLEELTAYPGAPEGWRQCADVEWQKPMLTVDFRRGATSFSLFSTLTSLGSPFDVRLQEIRIESFFPADDGARQFFEGMGKSAKLQSTQPVADAL